ncbi:hypothetical protein ACFVZW_33760 [Streptomyces sp. NPDC059567]|uniref:hypothetical protein n=1 Tax=Streptomyces sp. NPDC059567 TaxID=3346867 RepID=UPI003694F56E
MTSPTAVPPFAAQRARWRNLLLGPGLDATTPHFARRLTGLGATAAEFLATMDRAEGHLWPQLPYHGVLATVPEFRFAVDTSARDGASHRVTVTLGRRPADQAVSSPAR